MRDVSSLRPLCCHKEPVEGARRLPACPVHRRSPPKKKKDSCRARWPQGASWRRARTRWCVALSGAVSIGPTGRGQSVSGGPGGRTLPR
eukprot:352661-Chlamydomonas_euryale.AAC.1